MKHIFSYTSKTIITCLLFTGVISCGDTNTETVHEPTVFEIPIISELPSDLPYCKIENEEPLVIEDITPVDKIQPHAPQKIIITKEWVAIGNTGVDIVENKAVYGDGNVQLIKRSKQNDVYIQLPLSKKNPVDMLAADDRLYVLNAGTTKWNPDTGKIEPTECGSIDVFQIFENGKIERRFSIGLPHAEDGTFGNYISLAPRGEQIFLSSGISDHLLSLDLAQSQKAKKPVGELVKIFGNKQATHQMVRLFNYDRGFAALSGNQGALCLVDKDTPVEDAACNVISQYGNDTKAQGRENAHSFQFSKEGTGFTLVSVDYSAYFIYETQLTGEVPTFARKYETHGQMTNALNVYGDKIYLVNSQSNNITTLNMDGSLHKKPFAVFNPNSNPFGMAIEESDDGTYGWVTLQKSNQVAKVDLDTGEILAYFGKAKSANE